MWAAVGGDAHRQRTDDGSRGLPFWAGSLAGWTAPFIGVLWWLERQFIQWQRRSQLCVVRKPVVEAQRDEDDRVIGYAQTSEIVKRRWVGETHM